jgi:hypothetical protein
MGEIANITVKDLVNSVDMNVSITGYRGFRVRLYLGVLLIRAGMRVIGITGRVTSNEE